MNFVCPRCKGELMLEAPDQLRCEKEALVFRRVDGIWRFLLPERESRYSRFIKEYEEIRRFEGRFSGDNAYYRGLPFQDLSGRFSSDWKIRAASFRALIKMLPENSTVLDLGAGNGWLSNRLVSMGHVVSAVDLLTNADDGLGVWKFYETKFTPVQAEFSFLPFQTNFIDFVIFNASIHYAEKYEQVLTEALRVLRSNGLLIILDSPVYHEAGSGQAMIEERKSKFLSQYGFASDAIQSEGFLTYDGMEALGQRLGITWRHFVPNYGWKWRIRPFVAFLRRKREPAEFGIWLGRH